MVARLYPGRHWPTWLNEGFAEYMKGASIAARKGQYVKGHQHALQVADLSLEQMFDSKTYPTTPAAVHQFYQSSEKFVRFLMNDSPKDRFPTFIDAVLGGKPVDAAIVEIYGDRYKDFETFKKRYKQFSK